jgi:hypothetical protein
VRRSGLVLNRARSDEPRKRVKPSVPIVRHNPAAQRF